MTSDSAFQMLDERGWRAGLWNLTRKENRDWWGTRTWLLQGLVWLVLIGGLVLMIILMSSDPKLAAEADPETARILADKMTVPLSKFFDLAGIALAIGVVILAQDEIIGERRSGTAAWILSKPVSRFSFIISKFLGNMPGIAAVMVLLPGAGVYLVVSLYRGIPLPVPEFLAGLAVLLLSLLFFLALTLMLGVLSSSRGLVLGLPLAFILLFLIMGPFLSDLYIFLPQALTADGETPSVAAALALGQPVPSFIPVIANAAWIVLFTAVAVLRFQTEEF